MGRNDDAFHKAHETRACVHYCANLDVRFLSLLNGGHCKGRGDIASRVDILLDQDPADPAVPPHLSLMYPTVEEATRIFEALAEGGQVTMKPGKTFWSEYFAMATDRFGTPWAINCEKQVLKEAS